jgi:hypothetical protein
VVYLKQIREFAKQNDLSYWLQTHLSLHGVADLCNLHERATIPTRTTISRELLADQVIHQLAMIAAHAALRSPNIHKGIWRLDTSAFLHVVSGFQMAYIYTLGLLIQSRMVARACFKKSKASMVAGGWTFLERSSPVRAR